MDEINGQPKRPRVEAEARASTENMVENNLKSKLQRVEVEERNWADLPSDLLSIVFTKLGTIHILCRAQAVCRSWRELSREPSVWRNIDLRGVISVNKDRRYGHFGYINAYREVLGTKAKLAREAVHRSLGHIENFYADDIGLDDLFTYIADRSTGGLRCFSLESSSGTGRGLVEFVRRCPQLEELELTDCAIEQLDCGLLGQACPSLKCFRLNRYTRTPDDTLAVEIASSMLQLRELQLVGNGMTNKGLQAILSKCTNLEHLDIRFCYNIEENASLKTQLATIKRTYLHGFPPAPDCKFIYDLYMMGDGLSMKHLDDDDDLFE